MSIIVSTLSSRVTLTTNPPDDWARPRLLVSIITNDEWQRDEWWPGWGTRNQHFSWNQHVRNPADDDTDYSDDSSEDSLPPLESNPAYDDTDHHSDDSSEDSLPPLESSDEAEESDDDIPPLLGPEDEPVSNFSFFFILD